MRVGSRGLTSHNEIDYLRESVESYCIRTGSLYAHWRRFTAYWNPGPCPACENDLWGGAETASCKVCFGTGYYGGYSKPVIQWMVVQDQDESIKNTQLGFIRIAEADSVSPYLPKVYPWDLLGKLVMNEKEEYEISERFVINGTVRPHRLGDDHVPPQKRDHDHLTPETNVAAYLFNCQFLPMHLDEEERHIEYSVPFKQPFYLANPDEYRV